MPLLWAQHSQEDDWVFLLIDVRNAFDEDNLKVMVWAI